MPEHAWHPRSHAAFAQVAITHAHINHFNGATRLEGSGDGEHFVATVPTARSYLGRADWAELDASGELRNTEATTSHTLVP